MFLEVLICTKFRQFSSYFWYAKIQPFHLPLSVRHATMGDVRQVREGGADAAVPHGDPCGDRATHGTGQERNDDAVQAHHS